MGLFDKIFGDSKKANAFMNFLKEVAEEKEKEKEKTKPAQTESAPAPAPAPAPAQEYAPPGTYWGELMPAEENQYSFNGTWLEYFEQIFRTEFSAYRIECVQNNYRSAIFTFYDGTRKALVTEILPSSSAAQKLRRDTLRAGIPYLRYYHDHEGWWNVRSYVVNRTKEALGI